MPGTISGTRTIPTVDDLAADVITHHYDDLIAPPGLTNFLGTTVVGHDLTSLAAVTFPPVSQGLALTGTLFVDGRVFESYGIPISHAWRPDRVVRSASVDGLDLETVTVCVPGETAVAIDVRVTNRGASARRVSLTMAANARVVQSAEAWGDAESPNERNEVTVDAAGNRLVFESQAGTAWSIQGLDRSAQVRKSAVPPTPVDEFEVGIGGAGRGGELETSLDLAPGETGRFGYVQAVATTREAADAVFDRVAADVPGAVSAAEEMWNAQLEAVFTPGNSEYSGHLPVLETTSDALRRLYWWGALGTIWFRREFAGNVHGRSYDTLMPNYWATATFIWDYSLSSVTHAMLDPVEMRRQLRHWIASDIHTHFGTSSITGGPLGRWYSVNDYAMTRLVSDYVRLTGDIDFLDEVVGAGDSEARRVADHLVEWAEAWKTLRAGGRLADYGEIDNLLECVSSYTHEVASLNAANVWNLRTAASILDRLGDTAEAERLRNEAETLLPDVLSLYLDGTGHFAAGQPDGTRIPVKHCYDFNVVGTTIADDLDPAVREQMVRFFQHDLQTDNWMRALSPGTRTPASACAPTTSGTARIRLGPPMPPGRSSRSAPPTWPFRGSRVSPVRPTRDLPGRRTLSKRPCPASPAGRARLPRSCRTSTTGRARPRAPGSPWWSSRCSVCAPTSTAQ
ncbi:hypothetical protein [Leifsonia poae]|uniref:hypothetical protein n=1 Tax=Leifsonia poae TaxID=110933 RepID=UPI003D66CC20